MLEIVKNEYGKEYARFELDYLGEHPGLDAIIMNASVRLFTNGIHIGSSLNSGYVYMPWGNISRIVYTNENQPLFEITSSEGIVKLQKVKPETNLNKLKSLLRSLVPHIEIEEISAQPEWGKLLELSHYAKRYEEQEHRIQNFVSQFGASDEWEILKAWKRHLTDKLSLPFEATIMENSPHLRQGDTVHVTGLDEVDDLYGILANLQKARKHYVYPLCDLEATDQKNDTFQLVYDYSVWFSNR